MPLSDLVHELLVHDADPARELPALALPQQVELAWALKDEAIACWTAEPLRTRRCAALANALARSTGAQEIAAAASWCAGMDRLTLGEMESALEHFDRARSLLERLGQPHRAAQSQIPRLIALSMLGRHDDAVASAEVVRAQLIACGDELGTGKVELNLGSMLLRQDRYEAAAASYRQAAARFARAGDARHSIMADIGLAGALTWQYEFDEALRLYERAAMRVRSRGLDDLQGVIDTNRGRLELQRGRFDAALGHLEAALQEAERHGSPQDLAEARRDVADAYLALNLLPEAVALYDQTIETCRAMDAPVERAWAELQRAQALAHQGDPLLAAHGLDSARALFRAHDNNVGLALADLRLAALRLDAGDAATALALAQTAAAAFAHARVEGWRGEAELVGARALAALGRADEAQAHCRRLLDRAQHLPELAAAGHVALGRLLRQQGDAGTARQQFETAASIVEAQRAGLPGDELRVAYGAGTQAPLDALVDVALDATGAGAPEQLMAAMERARAQALATALARADAGDGVEPRRRERLHWLHGQWQDAVAQGEDERAAGLQQRMRALESEWLEHQRRALAASGGRERPHGGDQARFDLERLRDRLADGAALVEYAVVGERVGIVVATGRASHRVVVPAAGLGERIAQVRFQIDALRFGAPTLARHAMQMTLRVQSHLQALHSMLWQPITQWLAGCEQVVVVPHRELHYVPFCALHDGRASLVERHEFVLAPSASLWSAPRERRGRTAPLRRGVVFGVAGHSLPHVTDELRAVAAAFESLPGGTAVLHQDERATLGALHDALPGADVLHLACHGQFRADSPDFSALHLADGVLTVRDAARLPLQAQLVTLSACETGLSRVAPGDELLGLLRGFLLAGAPQVLASQWTVDDANTAALMRGFYSRLLTGARPAAALRAAQRDLAAHHPHPGHWAAFALHQRG